jgi:hypothetical protein
MAATLLRRTDKSAKAQAPKAQKPKAMPPNGPRGANAAQKRSGRRTAQLLRENPVAGERAARNTGGR